MKEDKKIRKETQGSWEDRNEPRTEGCGKPYKERK
jgi:hypothetical protein